MKPNAFLKAIRAGQQQIGLWVGLANNYTTDLVAGAGFDWLVIDMEHGPGDMLTTVSQLQAAAGHAGTPLVRPPWNDAVMVKRLMDIGAPGIVFPMIQSVEEAENAVAATRYPPNGIRGTAGSVRGSNFARDTDYYEKVEDETAIIIQLETQEALAQATDIAAVDGVDGIFFGPADIAADMGLLGHPMHDDVWAQIMPVAKALMGQGMPVGTLVTDPVFATKLLGEGFTFVACGTDTGLLTKATNDLVAQMQQATSKDIA